MMRPLPPLELDLETIRLRGFARGVTEIQWLLVTLVLVYLVVAGERGGDQLPAIAVTLAYFVLSLAANHLPRLSMPRDWLVAVHTWAMIGFITWLLYDTGGITGPLAALYLLPVITSALVLGKAATLLEVGTIAACYLLLFHLKQGLAALLGPDFALAAAHVVMFLIVGYLTTMLSNSVELANRKLQQMASHDPLTGLYNRETLRAVSLPFYAAALQWGGRPVSVLVADIDDLKQLNAVQGPETGDLAIMATGRKLAEAIGRKGVVARYGDDEFVALLPDADAERTASLVRPLLETESTYGHQHIRTTLSIGIASFPAHGRNVEELLEKADRAMRRGKKAGGRAVKICPSKPAEPSRAETAQ